jgi:hypothetical protein
MRENILFQEKKRPVFFEGRGERINKKFSTGNCKKLFDDRFL